MPGVLCACCAAPTGSSSHAEYCQLLPAPDPRGPLEQRGRVHQRAQQGRAVGSDSVMTTWQDVWRHAGSMLTVCGVGCVLGNVLFSCCCQFWTPHQLQCRSISSPLAGPHTTAAGTQVGAPGGLWRLVVMRVCGFWCACAGCSACEAGTAGAWLFRTALESSSIGS